MLTSNPYLFRNVVYVGVFSLLLFALVFSFLKQIRFPAFRALGWSFGILVPYIFPWRWFGIDPLRRLNDAPLVNWQQGPLPAPDWFPEARHHLPAVPGDLVLLAVLFLVSVGLYFAVVRKLTELSFKTWIGITLLVLLCSWMHFSLRSPYSYIPHYEQPVEKQYWYHYYLFPAQKGAVNLDAHCFRPAEELFLGTEKSVHVLGARLFPTFLVSPLLVAFHPMHAWIGMNIFLWLVGIIALAYLSSKIFPHLNPIYAPWLMAVSQGLIVYVAQPMMYASAIAMLPIVLAVFYWAKDKLGAGSVLMCSLAFALWQLSYDNQPWYIGMFFFALGIGWERKRIVYCLTAAFLIDLTVSKLQYLLPGVTPAESMTLIAGHPIKNILYMIEKLQVLKFIRLSFQSVRGFGRLSLHAFNFLLIPAVVGLIGVRKQPPSKILWSMILPAFLAFAVMEMGENWYYASFPRIVYSMYPAVFLAAAYALQTISVRFSNGKPAIGLCFLALYTLYVNADVWGFPWIYYLWFNRNTGFSFLSP